MHEVLTPEQKMRINRKVDKAVDDLYSEAHQLGQKVADALGRDTPSGSASGRTQIRALQTIAGAATRTSELKNHIKNQTGKDATKEAAGRTIRGWATSFGDKTLGALMLSFVDRLAESATRIVRSEKFSESEIAELSRDVELDLQRRILHTIVASALYREGGVG